MQIQAQVEELVQNQVVLQQVNLILIILVKQENHLDQEEEIHLKNN